MKIIIYLTSQPLNLSYTIYLSTSGCSSWSSFTLNRAPCMSFAEYKEAFDKIFSASCNLLVAGAMRYGPYGDEHSKKNVINYYKTYPVSEPGWSESKPGSGPVLGKKCDQNRHRTKFRTKSEPAQNRPL